MKTILTVCALLVGLMVGGKAMACGGAAGGPLGRLAVKKTYRTPQLAARNAAAYAMSKKLLGQDSSSPSPVGKDMTAKLLKGGSRVTKTFSVQVKNNAQNGEVTGSAKVSVSKIAANKWRATVQSGTVDAEW
jgi:hypothetical protein